MQRERGADWSGQTKIFPTRVDIRLALKYYDNNNCYQKRSVSGSRRMKTQLRITKQRRIILEELRRSKSHPTADELYEKVRCRLPRISLGTVYRNLELLSRGGLIGKIENTGVKMRFDSVVEPHYHIHCRHCGRVSDLKLADPPDLAGLIENSDGFRVTGYRLNFTGVCPRCQQAQH